MSGASAKTGERPGATMTDVRDSRPVCLVRPPAVETFRFSSLSITPPLGLAYVAGAIERAGHRVDVVDAVVGAPERHTRYFRGYLVGLGFDEIAARIPADSKVVGITALFTHEWPAIVQLIEHIKRRLPDTLVIVGGEHVTSMPELCLLTSKADYVVLGEGEETIVELLEALDSGMPHAEMLGIGYRDGDGVVINARRERTRAIDDIARPAWHLIDLDTYHEHRWMGGMWSHNKSVPILATRGCPYQCTYCSAPNMWTPRWIPRDPKLVVDEIQHYYDEFGARNFPFQDLTAIIQRQWIIDFCTELLARGLDITWQMPTGTRSEAIDDEVAQLLKRTGMISMAYAPESGSEETRKLIKKKMKTDRMLESMRAAVAADLNVMVFMVIGFPHDKVEHIRENLDFFSTIAEIGINDAAVGFYMALPGTQIFESLYDSGQINLDRTYFRHILSSTSLWATSTYSGLGRAMFALSSEAEASLERPLFELVKIRASQLNGCAYCIDMHTKDARLAGETEQRIYALNAWRETPFFTDRERAALEWTEAVTRVGDTHVPDEIHQRVAAQFGEGELVALTMGVIVINAWNRLAVSFRAPAGTYQPKRAVA